MNAQLIPPGLVDQNIELFVHDDVLKAIYQGSVISFNDIPNSAKHLLLEEIDNQPEIYSALINAGIYRLADQLYVYAKCIYGGYNSTPDITEFGVTTADNHSCNCNGNCPLFEIVKHTIEVDHGHLTMREVEVIKLLAKNYMGKQIAVKLGICETTVNKHKQNIFSKTGLTSNVELAVWAINNNVL